MRWRMWMIAFHRFEHYKTLLTPTHQSIGSFYLVRSRQVIELWELLLLLWGGLVCSRWCDWLSFVFLIHNFLRGGIHRSLTRFFFRVGSIKIDRDLCSMARFLLAVFLDSILQILSMPQVIEQSLFLFDGGSYSKVVYKVLAELGSDRQKKLL